jgi:hypothetical protein
MEGSSFQPDRRSRQSGIRRRHAERQQRTCCRRPARARLTAGCNAGNSRAAAAVPERGCSTRHDRHVRENAAITGPASKPCLAPAECLKRAYQPRHRDTRAVKSESNVSPIRHSESTYAGPSSESTAAENDALVSTPPRPLQRCSPRMRPSFGRGTEFSTRRPSRSPKCFRPSPQATRALKSASRLPGWALKRGEKWLEARCGTARCDRRVP